MPTMMNAPLTDDEIDLIQQTSEMVTPGTAHPAISFDDVAQLCAQAREANVLRSALAEALDEWAKFDADEVPINGVPNPRIAELRRLVQP